MKHLSLLAAASVLTLAACTTAPAEAPEVADDATAEVVETVEVEIEETVETMEAPEAVEEVMEVVETVSAADALAAILDAQPEETKARYGARHPAETLAFFGVEPGMTVVEALPGGGWYSKILIPYLGADGTLIGGQYPAEVYQSFGFGDEWAAERIEVAANWATTAAEWGVEGAAIENTTITALADTEDGSVDAVLYIRALHNLSRFNDDGGHLDASLAEAFRVLKPGGVVGVVQHAVSEDAPDESAKGDRGYLKQSTLVSQFEAAGFTLVGESTINSNPNDTPSVEEIVWRLPPTMFGTEEGSPEREAAAAIGESNRMTLKFKKPA